MKLKLIIDRTNYNKKIHFSSKTLGLNQFFNIKNYSNIVNFFSNKKLIMNLKYNYIK
jgi:hypothetical protein